MATSYSCVASSPRTLTNTTHYLAHRQVQLGNKHLGKGYKSGDYFMVAINEQGQYIAFDDVSEIEGITKIGYRTMVDRFIVKKAKSLYEVVNWSPQNIINSMNGVGGTEWL